jgi:hypothetical protein
VIRLPNQLVETLKAMAGLEGEPHYQSLVRKWIEERLQQEARLALKLSKMPLPELIAALNLHVAEEPSTAA